MLRNTNKVQSVAIASSLCLVTGPLRVSVLVLEHAEQSSGDSGIPWARLCATAFAQVLDSLGGFAQQFKTLTTAPQRLVP
jgi:hypothetical protein